MHNAYIALGSNLASPRGTSAETVRQAVEELGAMGEVTRMSSLYHSEPVGDIDQPAFVNAALCLETSLAARQLMEHMQDVERAFGRDRLATTPKGPRTLDLDLLFFDDLILNSHALRLPHPELAGRRFVLQPMAEIAPTLVHPILGLTMEELLAALPVAGQNGIYTVHRIAQ